MATMLDIGNCKDLIAVSYSKQSKEFYDEDCKCQYTGHGLRIHTNKGEFDIDDLSKDEMEVEQLADSCTKGKLSLIHIWDVIDDFLN